MKRLAFAAAALSAFAASAATVLTTDNVTNSQSAAKSAFNEAVSKSAFGQTLNSSLNAVAAHLNAEDAHFVVTNYDSSSSVPEAAVEIKVSGNWLTIWKETMRWNKFVGSGFGWGSWGGFHAWETNVNAQLDEKATKNWGMYDSETGEESPAGYTQISSSNVLVAAGMSYKRIVSTANSVWVLQCNNGSFSFGVDTNGYFRIRDGEGNAQFEIVKGSLREIGADAVGVTVVASNGNNVLTIPYSVVHNTHPTLRICTDLSAADWVSEGEAGCAGTVDWHGSSGEYVAVVKVPAATASVFVSASYMGGAETVINNIAPVRMPYVYIGNVKYAVGYSVIGSTGVMTLTPQQ